MIDVGKLSTYVRKLKASSFYEMRWEYYFILLGIVCIFFGGKDGVVVGLMMLLMSKLFGIERAIKEQKR